MAYNVLKGTVAGSVDQYGDQEIDGVKVFKNTISASVFYDTDAQSPCATLKDVPIQKLSGGTLNALITYQGEREAKTEYNLTFDGTTLKTKEVRAERLFGSAEGLTNLPANNFSDVINAGNLNLGSTLRNVRTRLQVNPANGIEVTNDGLSLSLNPQGALSFHGTSLVVDPRRCLEVTARGQNLSDDDLLIIHDASRGEVRRTSLGNLFSSYINAKSLQPEGPLNSIQVRGRKGMAAHAALTFDISAKRMNLDGTLSTDLMEVSDKATFRGEMVCQGAVYKALKTVRAPTYEIAETDYTILADTTDNEITIMLPHPAEHTGRVLIIKKINNNKYKLNSNPLNIKSDGALIDISESLTIKYNYSTRTLQSDGDNWWVINKSGS